MEKYTIDEEAREDKPKLIVEVDGSKPHTISASGELDYYTKSRLMSAIENLFSRNDYEIVLDLSGITFIDSSGLSLLVLTQRLVESHNGQLNCVLNESIMRVLNLTGLQKLFNLFPSKKEAKKALI